MNRSIRLLIPVALATLSLLAAPEASAHWCTNIYDTSARIVVKPERATIFVGNVGDTETLRVWVRNNFPYLITDVEMQATNGDFDVSVSPARQNMRPGEEVAFDFTITRTADSGDDDLRLQIRMYINTHGSLANWRDDATDRWTNPAPSENSLRSGMSSDQAWQLNAEKLAELYNEADGEGHLVFMYGRPRLGYNNSGVWGDGEWFPNRSLTKYDYLFVRAGIDLARRQASESAVVDTMVAAMDDPDPLYRGTSALIGAYVGREAVRSRLETMATADSCVDGALCSHYSWSASADARLMAKAALLLLGDTTYESEVRSSVAGASESTRMVLAAALGLVGDDDAVTTHLIPLARDTDAAALLYLHGAYLLSLVASDRRGPDGTGCVTFYGESCGEDTTPPRAPTNLQVRPAS